MVFCYICDVTAEKSLCLDCGKPISGRSDKKFCNDICRNSYNNKLNSDSNNYVRTINNALRKNRRILEELIPGEEEKTKVSKSKLDKLGFNFSYFTNEYITQKGQRYFFVYEYGYLPLDDGWYAVVKRFTTKKS